MREEAEVTRGRGLGEPTSGTWRLGRSTSRLSPELTKAEFLRAVL